MVPAKVGVWVGPRVGLAVGARVGVAVGGEVGVGGAVRVRAGTVGVLKELTTLGVEVASERVVLPPFTATVMGESSTPGVTGPTVWARLVWLAAFLELKPQAESKRHQTEKARAHQPRAATLELETPPLPETFSLLPGLGWPKFIFWLLHVLQEAL